MITSILSVLCALLILAFLITLHEFGHFIVGRLFHFQIDEFSIGMGPKLFSHKGKEVLFAVRAFPIGGMCVFYGEDEEIKEGENTFRSHNVWERILVVFAGPFTNILLAVLLSAFSLSVYGKYIPKINSIDSAECPAYTYGLRDEDLITKINGKDIVYFNQLSEAVESAKEGMTLTVIRSGEEKNIRIDNLYNKEAGKNYLGIRITTENLKVGFPQCFTQSFDYFIVIFRETFKSLSNIFKGNVSGIAGPVGTVAYVSEAVKYGLDSVISLAILINASIGIMNLLPLPALDGGRMVFMFIEAITGKPLDPKKEGLVHFIGIVVLLALIVLLSFNDFSKIFHGELIQ